MAGKTMNQKVESEKNIRLIQDWLIEKIANMEQLDPASIDVQEPLANYGLSSMAALTLSGDIETWLNCELEPTLVWDYPSVEQLSHYLAQEVIGPNGAVTTVN